MHSRNGISPWRLIVLLVALAGCTLALVGRIGYLQIIQHDEFVQQADENHWSSAPIPAHRGAINDRDGNPLAISIARWEVAIDPSKVTTKLQRDRAVAAVAKALGQAPSTIEAAVESAAAERQPVALVQSVETGAPAPGPTGGAPEEALPRPVMLTQTLDYGAGKVLADMRIPGVMIQERIQRMYPEGNLAATLLGITGRDKIGLTGIEADFDRDLAGVEGKLVFERDSIGDPIPLGYRSETRPKAGADLVLTIDRYIQRFVERELDAALKKHEATGGSIIVMQPQTGAILAMASRPNFDLRNPPVDDPDAVELFRNRAITDLYEPGSTFKLITMSSAINEGVVTPDTTYNDDGPAIKYGVPIQTWDYHHYGEESMTELLIHSNNVGAVWVSDQLGTDKFYEYVQKFGFGQPTDSGLSGEASGSVRTPKDVGEWWPIDLATNSFGQGLSVTPLQLVTAVSSVVNGGTLMRPYIVQRIESPNETRTIQPTEVRRVLTPEVSQTMRDMMLQVAEQGSIAAKVSGFKVGVKTGTASVPGATSYTPDTTIASIVGFAPYQNPRAVVLVKIDHPQDSPWGGVVAAPVFSNIMREILVYWRIPPSHSALVKSIGQNP